LNTSTVIRGGVQDQTLSRFCHFVDAGNGYEGLFHSLSLKVVALRKEIAVSLRGFPGLLAEERKAVASQYPHVFMELARHGFINSDDDAQLFAVRDQTSRVPIRILYLLLTDACNLKCDYCYVRAALPVNHHAQRMSWNVARKALDLFQAQIERESNACATTPHIILHGGEPFLAWDLISRTLEYVDLLRKHGGLPDSLKFNINTNGTLITKDHIAVLSNYPFLVVSVSLDGPQRIHDDSRRDVYGNGSFERVSKTIDLLLANRINVALSCTLTPASVDSSVDTLRWLHHHFPKCPIGFNIFIDALDLTKSECVNYSARLATALVECFEIAQATGIYEDAIMRRVNAFIDGVIRPSNCGACGQQIVISPEGMIGVCHAFAGSGKYFLTATERRDVANHRFWREWRSRSPLNIDECQGCIALGNCGGGCPYTAERMTGSIWGIDGLQCAFSKRLLEHLIARLTRSVVDRAQIDAGFGSFGEASL
jgi:uncharacterized protein